MMPPIRVGLFASVSGHNLIYEALIQGLGELGIPVTLFACLPQIERFEKHGFPFIKHVDIVPIEKGNGVEGLRELSEKATRAVDVLFYDEVYFNLAVLSEFHLKLPVVLCLHDINCWLDPIKINGRSTFIQYWNRRRILKQIAGIGVLSENLRQYIHRQKKFPPVHTLFPGIYHPTKKNEAEDNSKKLSFIIPGIVDFTRRDYRELLDAFLEVEKRLPNKASLTLLGTALGENEKHFLNTRCLEVKENGIDLRTFDQFVSYEEFEQHMQAADFIISPSPSIFMIGKTEEYYGISKVPGVYINQIVYGLPALLSASCPPDLELKSSTLPFEGNDQLIACMIEIVENASERKRLKQEAVQNSWKFTAESYAEKLDRIICSIVKKSLCAS